MRTIIASIATILFLCAVPTSLADSVKVCTPPASLVAAPVDACGDVSSSTTDKEYSLEGTVDCFRVYSPDLRNFTQTCCTTFPNGVRICSTMEVTRHLVLDP